MFYNQSMEGHMEGNIQKDLLIKNPHSAFTVWFGVNQDLVEYIKSLKKSKHQHVMLLVLQDVEDFANCGQILKGMFFKHSLSIRYQSTKKDGIRSITQTAFLLTSKKYVIDLKECSWFFPDHGYPTSDWDTTPYQYSIKGARENRDELPFGQIGWDIIMMMMNISHPLNVSRWTYVGPKNPSVVQFSREILPCNYIFER
jgi:hypothetical protein